MENFQRTKELTKERLLARRRERRNRLLWHVAICSAIIVIVVSIGSIILTASADKTSEYTIVIHSGEEQSHYVIESDGQVLQNLPFEGKQILIECKTNREDENFSDEAYTSLVELTAQLIKEYDLKVEDVVRHYDITGEECPKYFVEYESAWEDFKLDLEKYIDENGVTS